MSSTATETDWFRRIAALTVEPDGERPEDPVVAARLLVVRLVCTARLVASSPTAAAACPPVAAGLATELSAADVPHLPRIGRTDARTLAADYLEALCGAAGAVYFCRRIEHASGRCWFSVQGPGADLCGRVLAAGHRCSTPTQDVS
ncbi:MAG TPA: hypothetical protein VM324_13875 [Egibacteraceae bacterium]|nr:hypothetical protein [Egibacteraceae bacterium]